MWTPLHIVNRFTVFANTYRQLLGQYLKLDHENFPSHPQYKISNVCIT
jgi:hypothetical protein